MARRSMVTQNESLFAKKEKKYNLNVCCILNLLNESTLM